MSAPSELHLCPLLLRPRPYSTFCRQYILALVVLHKITFNVYIIFLWLCKLKIVFEVLGFGNMYIWSGFHFCALVVLQKKRVLLLCRPPPRRLLSASEAALVLGRPHVDDKAAGRYVKKGTQERRDQEGEARSGAAQAGESEHPKQPARQARKPKNHQQHADAADSKDLRLARGSLDVNLWKYVVCT